MIEDAAGYMPSTGLRVAAVGAGILAIGYFGALLFRAICSFFGRGPGVLTGWHVAMHNGDVESASAGARSQFHGTLSGVILGGWCLLFGILGGGAAGLVPWIHVVPGCMAAVLLLWGWIEREFGWPGLFVDPSLKQMPARRRLRAMRQSSGEEESWV
jgi:hypothetical protein